VLGPELLAVLQEAFQAQHGLCLPPSITQGVITLLYKGKGSKALVDGYRPITLLNSDHPLWACPPACGGPNSVCFVPGWWIGEIVLCLLEQVEYLQDTGQPGCVGFLDFSKAYNCLSRLWVLDCYFLFFCGTGELVSRCAASYS